MAFPTVASETLSTFTTDVTNHNVSMPATVNAGELLLCLFCNDGSATVTTPSGWTQRWSQANGSAVRLSAYYRIANGSEGGTTVNFVTSAAETAVARVYRITNWHGTSAPEAATATGSTSTPNPPALTPSWGAQDTLWVACHGRSSSVTLSSYPANYSNGTNDSSGSGTAHAQLSVARRELNAATEDPGTFTLSGSAAWVAATVAIRPVGPQIQTMGAATASAAAPAALVSLTAALGSSGAQAQSGSITCAEPELVLLEEIVAWTEPQSVTFLISAPMGAVDAWAEPQSVTLAINASMGAVGAQAQSGSITYTATGGVLMGAVGAQAEAPALLASLVAQAGAAGAQAEAPALQASSVAQLTSAGAQAEAPALLASLIASAASAGAQAEAPSLLASLVALAASTGAQAGAPSLLTSLAAQAALAQASAGVEAIAAFQVVALQQAQALAEAPSITVVLLGLVTYVYLQGHSAPVLFNLGHHAPTHYLIGTQVGMLYADAHYALSLYLRGQTDIIRLEGRS